MAFSSPRKSNSLGRFCGVRTTQKVGSAVATTTFSKEASKCSRKIQYWTTVRRLIATRNWDMPFGVLCRSVYFVTPTTQIANCPSSEHAELESTCATFPWEELFRCHPRFVGYLLEFRQLHHDRIDHSHTQDDIFVFPIPRR